MLTVHKDAILSLAREAGLCAGLSHVGIAENNFGIENCAALLVAIIVYGNAEKNAPCDTAQEPHPPAIPAKIAAFARKNYYRALVKKLQGLVKSLILNYGGTKNDYRIYCNSTALDEKKAALEAGLGVFGRNGLVMREDSGSLFLIGVLSLPFFVDGAGRECPENAALSANIREFPLCKNCGERPPCHAACLTGALSGGAVLDREKCVQWHISREGKLPREVLDKLDGRLYGCDLCVSSCPHNKKPIYAESCDIGVLPPALDAAQLAQLSDAELKAFFHGTALGLSRLCPSVVRRNLEMVIKEAK